MAGAAAPGRAGGWICVRAAHWHLRETHQGELWVPAQGRRGCARGDAHRAWGRRRRRGLGCGRRAEGSGKMRVGFVQQVCDGFFPSARALAGRSWSSRAGQRGWAWGAATLGWPKLWITRVRTPGARGGWGKYPSALPAPVPTSAARGAEWGQGCPRDLPFPAQLGNSTQTGCSS